MADEHLIVVLHQLMELVLCDTPRCGDGTCSKWNKTPWANCRQCLWSQLLVWDSIMYYCGVDLDAEFQCIDHMTNTVMRQLDCAKAETFNNINVAKPCVIIIAFVD